MTNHATAETWLRNAPAGVRSVTLGWEYWLSETGDLYRMTARNTYRVALSHLPPGTYTLNYREGLQLDAQEAWDYLAGGEGRRCFAENTKDLIRIRDGAPEVRIGAEWECIYNSKLNGKFYTIAPDEPAASEHSHHDKPFPCPECAPNEPAVGRLQALGALADALPVDVDADNEATRLRNKRREGLATRKIERACCREARELADSQARIADEAIRNLKDANERLETLRSVRTDLCKALGLGPDATWGDVERRCVSAVEVAELEGRLAAREEGLEELAEMTDDEVDEILRGAGADPEAVAERGKTLVTVCMQLREARERVVELEGDYESTAAELQEANESVNSLLGQVTDLRVKLKARRTKAEKERDAAIAERDKLRAEVESWHQVFLGEVALEDIAGDSASWPAYWRNHETRARAEMAKLRAEVERLTSDLDKVEAMAGESNATLRAEVAEPSPPTPPRRWTSRSGRSR